MNEDDVTTSSSTAAFASSIAQFAYTRGPTGRLRTQKEASKSASRSSSADSGLTVLQTRNPLKRAADGNDPQDSGPSVSKRSRDTHANGSTVAKPTDKISSRSTATGKGESSVGPSKSGTSGKKPEILQPVTDILADDLDSACSSSSEVA